MYGEIAGEKDRFFSRLATIRGLRPLPSVGDWILIEVEKPAELARKVNRRLVPGSMSVPRGIDSAVRVHVGSPRDNERLLVTLRDLQPVQKRSGASRHMGSQAQS